MYHQLLPIQNSILIACYFTIIRLITQVYTMLTTFLMLQSACTVAAVALYPMDRLSPRDVAPTCIPGTSECFKIVDESEFHGCPKGWRAESNLVNGAGQRVADKCVGTCSLEEEAKCFAKDCAYTKGVCTRAPKSSSACMGALEKCTGGVKMDKSVCTDAAVVAYFFHVTGPSVGEYCPGCAIYSKGVCTLNKDLVDKNRNRLRDAILKPIFGNIEIY